MIQSREETERRTIRLMPQDHYMHFGVYRIACAHAGCDEPAYYIITWPLPQTDDGFGRGLRCADHALQFAKRWRVPFPGLKAA